MKQPFDTKPFRQINVAEWLHLTMGCGCTLSVTDSKARANAAMHAGAISESAWLIRSRK